MANIEVEGARRGVWPWVLGLLAVALLVAALSSLMSDASDAPAAAPGASADSAAGV